MALIADYTTMAMSIGSTDHRLLALYTRGRAAWPAIDLDLATFSALAAGSIGEGPIDDARAGDLYLAIACQVGNDPAILAFDRHYLSRLIPVLIRRGLDSARAADVVQAVRMRFLVGEAGRAPKIARYDGRGSLAAWLQVASVRIAISAERKHGREIAVDDLDVLATAASPELDLVRLQFNREFESAFRAAFEALTPRERNLLRYQLIDRIGIDRIAALHGIHRATAARWIAHARRALLVSVRRAIQDRLQLDTAELESLFRQLRSKIEISLRWLLTPAPRCARPGPAAAAAHGSPPGVDAGPPGETAP